VAYPELPIDRLAEIFLAFWSHLLLQSGHIIVWNGLEAANAEALFSLLACESPFTELEIVVNCWIGSVGPDRSRLVRAVGS